jgi:hypothetical protein
MVACAYHLSYSREPKIEGVQSRMARAKSETLSPKYYQSKEG